MAKQITDGWHGGFPYDNLLPNVRFRYMRPFAGPKNFDFDGWRSRYDYEIHHGEDIDDPDNRPKYPWWSDYPGWPTGQPLDTNGNPPPEEQMAEGHAFFRGGDTYWPRLLPVPSGTTMTRMMRTTAKRWIVPLTMRTRTRTSISWDPQAGCAMHLRGRHSLRGDGKE